MQTCAATPCGKMYMEYKAVKELNMKGIYPPNQIQKTVESYWPGTVGKNEMSCDKDKAREVSRKTVDYLGS